jgi:hypothetical protein
MTRDRSPDNALRRPTDKANDAARDDRASPVRGAGGPQDSDIIQSAVAALGASVTGARDQADELDAQRRAGRHPDIDDTDGGWSPTSPPSAAGAGAGDQPAGSAESRSDASRVEDAGVEDSRVEDRRAGSRGSPDRLTEGPPKHSTERPR